MSSGVWQPHTSSVQFCEPDYQLTPYLAEPFNAISSLCISWFGIVGLLYGNPTKEWPFLLMNLIIIFIGLGSFALHATLHWLPQSFDEVPMLWYSLTGLYTLSHIQNSKSQYSFDYTVLLYVISTVGVTAFYYSKRDFFLIFATIFTSVTVAVSVWDGYIVWTSPRDSLLMSVWSAAVFVYFGVASMVWLVDMQLCDWLLPIYQQGYGFTIHVLWHLLAGLGAHLLLMTMVIIRSRTLKLPIRMSWRGGIPIIVVTTKDKSQ